MVLEDFIGIPDQPKELTTNLAQFALKNMEDYMKSGCFNGGSHKCLPELILNDLSSVDDLSVDRILDALKPTAKRLTLENMDLIGKVVSHFPDGRIDPDDLITKLQLVTGKKLDGPLADMIKNIDHIDKNGDHFDVKFHKPLKIEQNEEVPGTAGLVKVKEVEIKDLSFDVVKKGNQVSLKNIKGVDVNVDLPGPDLTVPVQSIDLVRGPDGKLQYQATAKNTHVLAGLPGVPGEFKTTLKVDKKGDLVVAKT